MKRLFNFEQQIGKYGEKLVAAPASTKHNQWIVKEIRTILDKKMVAHSSKPELTQHFSELFSGLDKIIEPSKRANRNALAQENTEAEIIDIFDEKYFNGQASFEFTTKVLADKRVQDINHFIRAVAQGGTILRSWTSHQRDLFQLHVANKLWMLGNKDASRSKLASDYESIWRQELVGSHNLSNSSLELLARALVVTRAVPTSTILQDVASNWRSLYVFWKAGWSTKLDPCLNSDVHLLAALNHIADTATPANVKQYLNITPAKAESAKPQIRGALLRYAQATKDRTLLDLLLASSDGEDKVVEAGALATILALA